MITPLIETERLRIIPLSHRQLKKYTKADFSLEKELGVRLVPRVVPPELADTLDVMLLPTVDSLFRVPLFFTLWSIVHKTENALVGDMCFKGEPNAAGEVEVGYGTYDQFQNRGYMTEALGGLIGWAAQQPNIRWILAETDHTNAASQRILTKLQFEKYLTVDTMLWWRLRVPVGTST
jgi:[ribosomal protein S5]-alanine N-acetyltransferase